MWPIYCHWWHDRIDKRLPSSWFHWMAANGDNRAGSAWDAIEADLLRPIEAVGT